MENKKIAAIALIIAIALSAFGLAYAHWTDTATINGKIQMGTLTLAFNTTEFPTATLYYYNTTLLAWLLGEANGKHVASASATYEDLITDGHTGKSGYKTMVLTIGNAYPGLSVRTTWIPHNIGTVPLLIYGITLNGNKTDSTTGAVLHQLLMNITVSSVIRGTIWEDLNDNGIIDPPADKRVMELTIVDTTFPLQLEPCHSDKGEFDLLFDEDAEMCHTYKLSFSLLAEQYSP